MIRVAIRPACFSYWFCDFGDDCEDSTASSVKTFFFEIQQIWRNFDQKMFGEKLISENGITCDLGFRAANIDLPNHTREGA